MDGIWWVKIKVYLRVLTAQAGCSSDHQDCIRWHDILWAGIPAKKHGLHDFHWHPSWDVLEADARPTCPCAIRWQHLCRSVVLRNWCGSTCRQPSSPPKLSWLCLKKLGQRLQAMASSNGGKQSPKLVLFLFLCFVVFVWFLALWVWLTMIKIWFAYFSDGLKPPTSDYVVFVECVVFFWESWGSLLFCKGLFHQQVQWTLNGFNDRLDFEG